jgi:PAS domain S-box-containing protein
MGTSESKPKDEKKTKAELIAELEALRRRVGELDEHKAERKRAEDALLQSEETARAFLNAPANVAFLIDPQGTILSFNEPALHRTHLSASELRGRSLWEVLPPVVVPQRKARVEDAVATRRSIHFDEVREPALFENYFYPLFDAEGRVERIGVFCWGIGERERLGDALGLPDREFKSVASSSAEAAFELDEAGRITYANSAAVKRFGYGGEGELRGQEFLILAETPDAAGKEWLSGILSGDGSAGGEFAACRKNGTTFPVLLRSAAVESDGGGKRVRILAADITERKRVERALREGGDTARALAATESRCAMILDAEGQIVALNDASARRLVRPPARAVGTSFLEYFADDVAASKKGRVNEVLRTGKPALFYDGHGGAAYENDIYPILDADGKVVRLAYFSRDVTDRKQAEIELARYRRYLEELVEERTAELKAANARLRGEIDERRRALAELAESEERFRLLAEDFRDALLIYDETGNRLVYANPMAAQLSGLSRQDILGLDVEDAIRSMAHEDDREAMLAAKANAYLRRCAGSVEATEVEFRLVPREGEMRWIRLRTYPAVAEGKPTSRVFVILTDVTERKLAEEELRERAEKYHAIAERAPFGFYIHREGKILFANEAVREIIKYDPDDEIVGRSVFDFVPAEDHERVLEVMRERDRGRGPYPFALRIICKDGEIKNVETAGRAFDYGGEPAHMVTILDVTERRRAERALRESEERYRILVETSPDAVVQTDLEGRIVALNQRALSFYGVDDARGMIGKNSFDLIEPGQRQRAGETMRKVLEEGRAFDIEYQLAKADGTYYHAELSSSLVRDGEGNPTGFIGVIRDVSDRKEVEKKLRYFGEFNRNIIESTQIGIYALYKKGVVALWNQGMERQFGVPAEEVVGRNVFEVFPAIREEDLGVAIRKALENGESCEYAGLRHRTLNKGERVLNTKINPLRDLSGAVVGAVVITEDVSDAKRAEEEARFIGEFAQNIIRSTRAGIYALDKSGSVQIWNREMENQFGVSAEELSGRNIFDAFPVLREEPLGAAIEKALSAGESYQGEDLKHRTRLKGERLINTKVNPIKDGAGRILGAVVVTEDVTDK